MFIVYFVLQFKKEQINKKSFKFAKNVYIERERTFKQTEHPTPIANTFLAAYGVLLAADRVLLAADGVLLAADGVLLAADGILLTII